MSISAITILSVFLGLFGVLLAIALVHIIQGIRFGGNSGAMLAANTAFLVVIILISLSSWYFLRSVDWSSPFVLQIPSVTSSEPQ